MTPLPPDIKDVFFKTLQGDIPVDEFEQWLYGNKEIEHVLNPDDYLELISLNYKKSGARYELKNLLFKQIDLGEFETYKMLKLLNEVALKDSQLPYVLRKFYELYCQGYNFLLDLGVRYGLILIDPRVLHEDIYVEWDNMTVIEQQELIQQLLPDLDVEIARVKDWLLAKKIVLTGRQDNEYNYFEYEDYRTEEEARSIISINQNPSSLTNKK